MTMQYKVVINGTEYTHQDIRSGHIENPLFDEIGFGGACEAMFELEFRPKGEIPRMAELKPYVLEDNEWKPLKTFYIDERYDTQPMGIMNVVAYDSMLKADVEWVPDQSLEFPMKQEDAVSIIADLMGISVDSRCSFNSDYTVDYPANGYTLRNVLGFIASSHRGNFTITDEDKLLLVPLRGSAPVSTHYLVTEHGNPIVFGQTNKVRITI